MRVVIFDDDGCECISYDDKISINQRLELEVALNMVEVLREAIEFLMGRLPSLDKKE